MGRGKAEGTVHFRTDWSCLHRDGQSHIETWVKILSVRQSSLPSWQLWETPLHMEGIGCRTAVLPVAEQLSCGDFILLTEI